MFHVRLVTEKKKVFTLRLVGRKWIVARAFVFPQEEKTSQYVTCIHPGSAAVCECTNSLDYLDSGCQQE